jgi:outer membrane cobalamin receptor
MDAAAIENSPAVTADALLRELPGFDRDRSNSMFTNYGQLRVSFAGAGNDRGVVLADGVPAQDGFGGQIDWAEYPPLDLERAELLRGPGSALYGSGAIGGVLSLTTFGPVNGPPGAAQGFLQLGAGTHGELQNYARIEDSLSAKLAFSASADMQQLQYGDLAPGYQTAHDNEAQAQSSMSSLRLGYAASPQTILTYGYRGAWDYQQEGRPNYDFWRNLVQNAIGLRHESSHATVTANAYERDAFVTNRADKYPSSPGTLLYTQYVPTHETGVDAAWTIENPNSSFEVRSDGRFVGGVSQQFNGIGIQTVDASGTQDSGGLAIQETLRSTRAEFVAGLRGDTIATSATGVSRALSPRAALRYDLSKKLAFRVSAGGGFRAPFLNELIRGYVIGPISYKPNDHLVPERSSSVTPGFDWTNGRSELSADYLHTYVNDAIDFCTVSATVQQRCNFTHTRTDGTTLVYSQRTLRCARVSISGTQQYARITGGTPAEIGKQLPYVPKGNIESYYDTPVGHVETGVSVTYSGMTYADDLNKEPLGTAVIVGAHARFPLNDGASVILNASNLNDARYLSSIDRYAPPQVVSLAFRAGFWHAGQNDGCTR